MRHTSTYQDPQAIPAFRPFNTRSWLTNSALDLASAGFLVFACTQAKTPTGGRGHLDATTDRNAILAMFGHPAARMIGVPTGAANGFLVVDTDPRHDGDRWLHDNRGRLPRTRVHRSRSNGRHLLFRNVPGVRNSQSIVGQGVDVRGDGGYIIMPPSPGYGVVDYAEPADAPDWLVEAMLPKPKPERPRVDVGPYTPAGTERAEVLRLATLKKVSAAQEGQKRHTLFIAARTLGGIAAQCGFTEDQAVEWLMDALPNTVKDEKAAEKTARDGLRSGMASPITVRDRAYREAR